MKCLITISQTLIGHQMNAFSQLYLIKNISHVELAATEHIITALAELGVKKILKMSVYGLHANRMGGMTVATAQSLQEDVGLYIVVSDGHARETTGRLSLRGDTFNTATTRSKYLFIAVADVSRIIANCLATGGARSVLAASPVIPFAHFIERLHAKDIEQLNNDLETAYAPKKEKKRMRPA